MVFLSAASAILQFESGNLDLGVGDTPSASYFLLQIKTGRDAQHIIFFDRSCVAHPVHAAHAHIIMRRHIIHIICTICTSHYVLRMLYVRCVMSCYAAIMLCASCDCTSCIWSWMHIIQAHHAHIMCNMLCVHVMSACYALHIMCSMWWFALLIWSLWFIFWYFFKDLSIVNILASWWCFKIQFSAIFG